MKFDYELIERREAEWAATRTPAEADAVQARWAREDRERERAADYRERTVADLVRRVARLERIDKRDLHLRGSKEEFFRAIGTIASDVVIEELERRAVMRYAGVWDDERAYTPGDLVSHAGAGWVAIEPIGKGVKPGQGSTPWRMAIKATAKKEPTCV